MKVIAAKPHKHGYAVLTFEHDGETLEKYVRVSDCAKAVNSDLAREVMYSIIIRVREAGRDFAYKKYGPEWIKHAGSNGFWSGELSDEEKAHVMQAAALLDGSN